MFNVTKFVKEHIPLCVCTLGVVIFGYLGYHAIRWIINKCQKAEKIDQVAQKSLGVSLGKNPSSPNNITSPSHNLPSKISNSPPLVSEKAQGQKASLKLELENQKRLAVVKIQSAYRGHVARLALKKLQSEKLEAEKSKAAIKIQSIWRGYSARVKAEKARKPLLSYSLLEKAKPYIDTPSNLKDVPRASHGETPVYLPKELPIVLKQSGAPQNQKRFDQMQQGRDICEKNGYEHLVIPKARLYGNFIVESRLPITVHGTKEQIGLYTENRGRFASAVKEFTGFLCQSSFYDITGGSNDPYGTLAKTPVGRYDNIALYLEEDEGKIGLIDLEQFSPGHSKWQKDWCFFPCRDAVHLFPYHLDEIINAAKKFDSNIESYRKDLERERDEALKRFKIAYEDHLEFIKEKGITIEKPLEVTEIISLRKENIKEAMIEVIRKEHDDFWYKNCLGERPDEVIELFGKAFPKILDLTASFLSEMLKKRVEGAEEPISSFQQLVSYRTLRFSSSSKWYRDLQEKVALELQMMKIEEEWDKDSFASLIIQSIFEELAKGKEIAYYNPSFGYGGYATQCIFC